MLVHLIDRWDPNHELQNNQILNDTLNAPMTKEELVFAIRKAKSGKASGPDMVPVEFYKHGGETIQNSILAVFNFGNQSADYPQAWAEGIINPVYKAGKTSEPENYRKITLLTSLGKLFDSVLNNRLCFIKEALKLENPFQNGFKMGSQSTDNLFILNSILEKYEANKRPLYVCYVDFKSAFDYINRHALLFKLLSQGFHGKLFTLLRSLFSKSRCRVKWNNKLGELFENTYGVLQGGVISPSLFKLYIEDMRDYFGDVAGVNIGGTKVNHLLQADDLILMSETRTRLQLLLDRLDLYCRRWHLILNVSKTKSMIFYKKYEVIRCSEQFIFGNQPIEEVDHYKYLGIIISNGSKRFSQHFSYLKEKASRAIIAASIYIRQAVKGQLPVNLYLKVFDTQIRPILEYASEIWCQDIPIEELEQVQLKYLKTILGVSQSTPTAAVLGETDRFPLHMRYQDKMMKLWSRLNMLPAIDFLSKIYRELTNLSRQGHNTWVGRVDNAISKYTVNLPCHTNAINIFVNTVREMRYSQFISQWKTDLQENRKWPKLDTYKMIKHDYRVEPHILYVRNKRYQRALTRLRVSSHKLNIEAGRHVRPYIPSQQKVCLHCTTGELDDEFHFLLICHFHSEGRYSMLQEIGNYLALQPRMDKDMFIRIMTSKNQSVLNALGKCIYTEFKRRENEPAPVNN